MPDPHVHSHGTEDDSTSAVGAASGKVILLGEHAVVHGVPAIAVSLDKGATAEVRPATEDSITISGFDAPVDRSLFRALGEVRRVLDADPVELRLTLNLPAGSGLGASAALGGATSRAIARLSGKQDALVASATDAWESVFHGNASGVDRAAALGTGAIRFVRGELPSVVRLRTPLHLVIAVAGPPAKTREMVESVMRLRQSNRLQFDKNLAAIESLVENALVCLRSGDHQSLGKLMDLCQMVLSGWMLSTEDIEIACRTAREAGALGAKLTGAGGGGCIVAISPSGAMSAPIEAALRDGGFEAFSARVDPSSSSGCQHHDHG